MNNENQQIIDANMIMKILYKNKFLIALTTVIVIILSTAFVFINKSFKSDIIMYGNDKVLTEIGENSQFSLSSFDFYSFLKKNSKTLRNVNLPEDKFFKEMTTRLTAQSETNDPTIKIKFTTNNKIEGENFAKEYPMLAQNYLLERKNKFLDSQIKLLEEQYAFLTKNIDVRTTKDSLTDTLVSRLAYYRLLKNDSNPVVKYVNSITKPALNKKLVIAGSLFLGLFLGILIAFAKEFSHTLDWKDIKKRKN
ncbi:lipopolysaccharide biosynthesis protein [Leptotrichia buccalis]